MNIQLDLIQSSPRPVRTSWDEDKMTELAQSIREQGVIVPVKVRERFDLPRCRWHGLDWVYGFQFSPTSQETCEGCSGFRARYGIFDDGDSEDQDVVEWNADARETYGALFELVYGHRRVEPARRAGLSEIPAIMDNIDDTATLIQALIENVQREDMNQFDQAVALQQIKDETGWNNSDLGRHGIITFRRASELLAILKETPRIQQFVRDENVTESHIRSLRPLQDPKDREVTIEKAVREELTVDETRHVAEAVRDAPNETIKQALLDTPVRRDVEYWKEAGSIAASDREQERAETYAMAPAVKDLLEIFKIARRILGRGKDSMDLGKMGPEHMPYIATQARKLAAWLSTWADELDTLREEIING